MRLKRPLLERFEEKIEKTDSCWNWKSATDGRYGVFWIHGRNSYAHRLSYLFYIGSIPEDMYVCHTCDNGMCVNPKHLFIGTAKDNAQDMSKKGRCRKQDGELNSMAKLTIGDIYSIKVMAIHGMPQKDIAKKFNVKREAIGKILRGERWEKAVQYSTL